MNMKEKILVWLMSLILGVGGSAAVSFPVYFSISHLEQESPILSLEERQQVEIISVLESDFFQNIWDERTLFDSDFQNRIGRSVDSLNALLSDIEVGVFILFYDVGEFDGVNLEFSTFTRNEEVSLSKMRFYTLDGEYMAPEKLMESGWSVELYGYPEETLYVVSSDIWKDIWGIK